MTPHDQFRADKGVQVKANPNATLEELEDAVRGLQSTDDPSLVPLYNELMERYIRMKDA